MINKLKPYSDYKDSGFPWLGNIPKHWRKLRCKYLFREVDERSKTGIETHLSMSQKYGLVDCSKVEKWRLQSESQVGGKLCQPGDLVLNRLKAHLGVFACAKQNGIVSPDYTVFRSISNNNVSYFETLFKTPLYIAEFARYTKGIVKGFWRLYTEEFYNINSIIPPQNEQEIILSFIVMTNNKIARFIKTKKRLIEVLKEQKQVIINHAVTKGIDPNVKLKPSGINCLGDIPEHWEVRRLRTVATVKPSGVDKNTVDGEIPILLCNYVDVYKNDYITPNISFMKATATQAEINAFKLRVGDVIITKDSEDWADIAVPAYVINDFEDVICAYHLAVVRPNKKIVSGGYLFRAFSSEMIADQFRVSANGITRYGLSQNAIKSAFFPVPPIDEQEKIVEYIKDKCKEIEVAIVKANREIELIHEYRIRLISDVVTGKVDVRDIPVEPVEDIEEIEELEEIQEGEELTELQEVTDADD